MTANNILIQLLMRFNHDELFYILITFLSFKGIEGFQTEKEGAVLMGKEKKLDYTFIGDYRIKIEKYGVWERTLKYNPLTKRLSSYIIFKNKFEHLIEITQQYLKELQMLLDQGNKDLDQYSLLKNRLETINSYLKTWD